MTSPKPTSNDLVLWDVGSVARPLFGLSERAFVHACDAGAIPITVERLGGKRLRKVRASEVNAYLRARHCGIQIEHS